MLVFLHGKRCKLDWFISTLDSGSQNICIHLSYQAINGSVKLLRNTTLEWWVKYVCERKYTYCHESGCHSLHLLHHTTAAHPPWTAFPIHHCTNHTAVTNHSFALIVSPHLHLIHTHTHISSTLPCTHCEVLFSPVWHFQAVSLSVFPCLLPGLPIRLISSLSATCPDLCIAPVADSALPSFHLLLSLNLACLTSSCLSIKLHLDLTTLPLHYTYLLIETLVPKRARQATYVLQRFLK